MILLLYMAVVCAVWLRRVFWVLSVRKNNPPLIPVSSPSVSESVTVIVPAKNEEKNIGNCLTHLFRQNYPAYSIVVVDDRSDDRTAHLVDNLSKLSPVPFKNVRIEKLPSCWTGKNHAMHAGAKAASGRWLLFTDADTTHKPESIATAVECALREKIDFLTLAPETESKSFWEKTVQPLAVTSLALWFDPAKINQEGQRTLANGQFILIRKDAYDKVGGSEAVKDQVVEDVELAKKVRGAGYSVRFLNGTEIYATRMYNSLKEIKTGWTRIYIHLFNKSIPAILHKILLFLIFSIAPFGILGAETALKFSGSSAFDPAVFAAALLACGFIIGVRFVGNRIVKTNPWYAFLHPIASLVLTWILLICVGRILFNRPSVWRGTYYK